MGKASKDKRDVYYRQAKEEGWRARSAFKLLQIDEEYHIFKDVKRVVDLCAAPGSWSQVLSKKLRESAEYSDVKIVAIDLQPMAPIPGVVNIQGDITELSTVDRVISEFNSTLADLIVFDGAPDVTGIHDLDEFIQGQLLLAAINISTYLLKPGGTFVGKIFRASDSSILKSQLLIFFKDVTLCKPRSSRNSSTESFVVCRNFELPKGYVLHLLNPLLRSKTYDWQHLTGVNRSIIPFMACGDLSAFDSDKGEPLSSNNEGMNYKAVSPPKDAPFAQARVLIAKRGKSVVQKVEEFHEDLKNLNLDDD